jgi:hypothetical protein
MISAITPAEEDNSFINHQNTDLQPDTYLSASENEDTNTNNLSLTAVTKKFGRNNILEILKEAELDASVIPAIVANESETYQPLNPDTINALFHKALENTTDEKIRSTYIRWSRPPQTRLKKLKDRFHHALALGYAKILSSDDDAGDAIDEIQKKAVEDALKNLKISKPCQPIDVDEVSFDNHPTTTTLSKDQISSIRDAQKLTYSEIPCYDFSDNLLEVQEFCDQVLIWSSLAEKHPTLFDKDTMMTQLLSKLGRNAKVAVKSEFSAWKTPRDLVNWLMGIKHVALDSTKARNELQKFRQYNSKFKQLLSIGDYFTALLRINNRIKEHDLKNESFQTAFISGLDRSIIREATQWHQNFQLANNTLPSNELLLRTVTILFDNRHLGFRNDTNSNNYPRVNRLTNVQKVHIGDKWDESYRKLKLRDYPELRALLTKLSLCHYCKNPGCAGFPTTTLCPLLVNKGSSNYSGKLFRWKWKLLCQLL